MTAESIRKYEEIREIRDSIHIHRLINFDYDDLGRRTSLSRASGVTTTYGYDGWAPRLTSFSHDLAGTAADLTVNLYYNPAGQITLRTLSNPLYGWTRNQ